MDRATEEKWQKRWDEEGIFEPSAEPGKEKFFITVPWPYANGSLHVGHGRTYTLADIIARYKRAAGYNVLFPMAFHQSGTPILAFSQRLRMKDPSTLALYRDYLLQYEPEGNIEGLLKSFEDPKQIADYFSRAVIHDFKSLGFSIDWTRVFTSADVEYQDFVKWQFRKLDSLGLIQKGNYPVLYSIEDDNAVGEDDIKDGDTDKVTIEEFTGVIFKGEKFSLIAASLRPETLFGITNLWISRDAQYVLCRFSGSEYALTREGYEKLKLQVHDTEFVREIGHGDIQSQKYTVPLTGKSLKVRETTFVDPDNGTGVVYSVPGHSIWDYIALPESERDGVPMIIDMGRAADMNVKGLVNNMGIVSVEDREKLVEATQLLYKEEFYNGVMNDSCGEFSGQKVSVAREAIKERIIQSGDAITFRETSRKAQTRSGSKVVVAVLQDQWFIDYSPAWLKERSHDLVNSMFYYPEFYRNAMNDAVDWLKERPCARRRGLGTRLPFDERWIIESLSDSTIYPAVYTCIINLKDIYSTLGELPDEVVEYVFSKGQPEVLDKYPATVKENALEARKSFDYWYGVDIRLTAYPHISNHLSFYVMNHAALFDQPHLPGGLIISGMVVSNGAKMSKSKGNVVSLMSVSKHYSADIYRLYVAIQSDIQSTLDWNEEDLRTIIKKYEAFRDLLSGMDITKAGKPSFIDLWFLSRFQSRLEEFRQSMDAYNLRSGYISIFYEVLNDIRRLESRGGNVANSMGYIIREWLIAMSPVIPHLCEELWHKHVEDSFVSTALFSEDENDMAARFRSMMPTIKATLGEQAETLSGDAEALRGAIMSSEDYIAKTEDDVREIIKATGIKPVKITIRVADQELADIAEKLLNNRQKELRDSQKRFIPEFMKVRKNVTFNSFDEYALLSANSRYLSGVFEAEVQVTRAGPEQKGKNPWPGRPLIRLD